MKVVETAGTPREIGLATGEALREEIRAHLELYPPAPDWEVFRRRLPVFLDTLRRILPAVVEEMEATAEGAHLDAEDIFALNLPLYANELVAVEGCTNVAFAHGPDGPLWGKNNDGYAPGLQRPHCARIVRPETGIPHVNFTFAGLVATLDGVNAEGLSVGHSSVGSVFQQSDRHVPIRLWAYEGFMRCRGTAEFVDHMAALPTRDKGYSILCADRHGVLCSLEAPVPLMQVRRPTAEMPHMNCVNYYQLPALAQADRRPPEGKENAIRRREFLDGWLAGAEDLSVAAMQQLLRHHGDASICRHGDSDRSHTEYSMISVPQSGRVLYLSGHPCCEEYTELTL